MLCFVHLSLCKNTRKILFTGIWNMESRVSETIMRIYHVKDFHKPLLFFLHSCLISPSHFLNHSNCFAYQYCDTVTDSKKTHESVTPIACASNNTVNRSEHFALMWTVIFPAGCHCSIWCVLKMAEYVKMSPTETSLMAVLIAEKPLKRLLITQNIQTRRCSQGSAVSLWKHKAKGHDFNRM